MDEARLQRAVLELLGGKTLNNQSFEAVDIIPDSAGQDVAKSNNFVAI